MGSIGGLLGTAGGAAGSGFSGPTSAQTVNPTNPGQITSAYNGTQSAMQQQQNLLQALQGQNGIANQSQVYGQLQGVVNGTGPNPAQAQLAQATGANTANQAALMAGQRGASQNAGLIARQAAQQGAANQQNSAGQAATMQAQQSLNALTGAGQLAGTQASNQIGQTNANTSAQQAEQQNLLNAQQAYNSAQVGMQSNINSVNGQLANTTMQGQQAMLGGLSNSMGGASGMLGGVTSMFGAKGGKVTSKGFRRGYDDGGQVSDDTPASGQDFGDFKGASTNDSINSSVPSFGSDAGAAALGGGSSGGKSGGGGGAGMMSLLALMAVGGEVKNMYANPTGVVGSPQDTSPTDQSGYTGKSKFGAFIKGQQKAATTPNPATPQFGNAGANALYEGLSGKGNQQPQDNYQYQGERGSKDMTAQYVGANAELGSGGDQEVGGQSPHYNPETNQITGNEDASNNDMPAYANGGKVPALVSPGEQYLKPRDVRKVKAGANPMKVGEKIPGKPKVGGAKNSYANDTVPKSLDEGGIVIPRSITQGPNAHWNAMKFVHQTLRKGKK